jgi:hypothetical protein
MQVTLSHADWRILRCVKRAKGKPVLGSALRLDMSRRTKDGQFLNKIVGDGLLEVKDADKDPFKATYGITELGNEAAEYGVYDVPWETLKARLGAKNGKKSKKK